MKWRGAVILNSGSGPGDNHPFADRLAEIFAAHGVEPTISVVRGRDVGEAARRALRDRASVVVAGGGDGTVSTVASVVAGTTAILGVLPLGTLNHFAKDLRIPIDIEAAAQTIAAGHSVTVDVGELNGRFFINNASLGLYPRLVWERDKERRGGRRKWLAVAVAVGRIWHHYRRVRVILRTDDQDRVVRTPFVFVGNNEYQLDGTKLGGRERLDGGRLHVCMAPGMTRMELVRVLLAAFTGRLHGEDALDSICVHEFSIEARRRVGVSLDGEVWVTDTPLRFRSRPGILRVFVPAS